VLSHSGRWRAVLAPSQDQPHLIDALDRVTRALGGVSKRWRFDRMSTVCHPGSGRVTASFSAVAKHYGVMVDICPPEKGNRKGVVEKANHVAAQRFWRTLPDETSVEQAQQLLDEWCTKRGDVRIRATADGKATVATLAAREPLAAVPLAPFPATMSEERTVSAQALVAWRGNRYSVPPQLAGALVTVSHRLGAATIDIADTEGVVLARHRLAPPGAGATVRDHGHVQALNAAAMAASTPARPHRSKQRIPPGEAARAAAAELRARAADRSTSAHTARSTSTLSDTADGAGAAVLDLSRYAAAAAGRNTLTP
jgi:hypothetical protein